MWTCAVQCCTVAYWATTCTCSITTCPAQTPVWCILWSRKGRRLTSVLSFHYCVGLSLTVLEGLFGEYRSSATLGQQRLEVIKQPLVCDWLATPEALMMLNCHFGRNTKGDFVLRLLPVLSLHLSAENSGHSVFRLYISIQLDELALNLPPLCPLGAGRHCLCCALRGTRKFSHIITVDVCCTYVGAETTQGVV